MLKNKKILVILLLTLILMSFSFSSCFASTTLINSLNVRDYFSLAEDYANNKGFTIYNYIITSNDSKSYIYIYPTETPTCNIIYSTDVHENLIRTHGCYILCFEDASNPMSYKVVNAHDYVGYTNADVIIWSSFDIYLENGTLFFQKTPLSQGILAPIMGEAKPAMKILVKEILGILPLIIVVVVSLVGLRKALQMLSTLLRRA